LYLPLENDPIVHRSQVKSPPNELKNPQRPKSRRVTSYAASRLTNVLSRIVHFIPEIQNLAGHDPIANILGLMIRETFRPSNTQFITQLYDREQLRPSHITFVPEKLRVFDHVWIQVVELRMFAVKRAFKMSFGLFQLIQEKVDRQINIIHLLFASPSAG
jgi:hypothetical protein